LWAFALLLYSAFIGGTFFVSSATSGMLLVALCGLPWAISQWAPFAIIGVDLSREDATLGYEASNRLHSRNGSKVVGLHNMAISVPQILAAMLTSGVLWAFETSQSGSGTVWALRVGAIASLVASYLASQIAD
jgi:solute carrier family 45 protein 1/2/4